jgi:hypothetical protein
MCVTTTFAFEQEELVRVLRKADARRAMKRAAVQVIENVYRRSPMFERLRLEKRRILKEGYNSQYQEVAECEQRNISVFGGQIQVSFALLILF